MAKGSGCVAPRVDMLSRLYIVCRLHDVIEVALSHVVSDMQNGDQALVRARHGLELLDAAELAFEGAVFVKRSPTDNLDGSVGADDVASQPHFAVSARAHATQQFVIRDVRGWCS